MHQSTQSDKDHLHTYVEADLAAWVRREANRRGYSTSGFMRIVLVWLREGMLQGAPNPLTMPGTGAAAVPPTDSEV